MTTQEQLRNDPTQYIDMIERIKKLLSSEPSGRLSNAHVRAKMTRVQRQHFRTNINYILDDPAIPVIGRIEPTNGKPMLVLYDADSANAPKLTPRDHGKLGKYFHEERKQKVMHILERSIDAEVTSTASGVTVARPVALERTLNWLEHNLPNYDVESICDDLRRDGLVTIREVVKIDGRVITYYKMSDKVLDDIVEQHRTRTRERSPLVRPQHDTSTIEVTL